MVFSTQILSIFLLVLIFIMLIYYFHRNFNVQICKHAELYIAYRQLLEDQNFEDIFMDPTISPAPMLGVQHL